MAQGLTLNELTATTFTNQNDLLLIYQTGSTLSISVGNLTKNIVNTNFTGGTLTITGNTTIIGNSNSDMLRVTQTGSGNAFVVEDSSNPDSTPFVITSGGTVGVGTTTPTHTFHVSGNSNPVRFEGLQTNTGATKTIIADNNGVLYVENKPKKYVALLTQSSTSAPTAIVLENTLGTVTFGYNTTGIYSVTATGLLTTNKTTIVTGGAVCSTSNLTVNGFYLLSYNIPNLENGILNNSTLEITVYP